MHSKTILAAVIVASFSGPVLAQSDDGGPDTLEVYGLTTKKHLNVRSGPSLKAQVISGLVMGETVKNLGCETSAEGRWCNIEMNNGTKGYSFGAFLKEASGTATAPPPPPAIFAVGTFKCEKSNGTPVADCSYGVMRVGVGKGRLQVVWPDATKRMFGIYQSTVTTPDGPATAKVGEDGSYNITLTPKGAPSEHYMVPAGVILSK